MEKEELTFTFWIEQGADGGWGATCPDLPGLLLAGDTREELLGHAKEIVADYLIETQKRGLPIPIPGTNLATVSVSA